VGTVDIMTSPLGTREHGPSFDSLRLLFAYDVCFVSWSVGVLRIDTRWPHMNRMKIVALFGRVIGSNCQI
jgi:hypothetical protein